MARILCIEDSREFQTYLSSILAEHALNCVGTIQEALRLLENGHHSFELILLDISLPDGNGVKTLPEIKERILSRAVPVIIISSDGDILTKVAAFGMGADDYLAKPFEPSELKARIEARLRWSKSANDEKTLIRYGDITIDLERMVVEVGGTGSRQALDLSPLEFKVLRLLLGRPGQVYSRDQIIERVWGVGRYITARTVDTHVSHLRQKIGATEVRIETVLGVGYKCALTIEGIKQSNAS